MKFNIITASHNEEILRKNLASSLFFSKFHKQILVGFKNISAAYNTVNFKCNELEGEYNIFIHHDVFLPGGFEMKLKQAIIKVSSIDPDWGVLGVAGAVMENNAKRFYGYLNDRGSTFGMAQGLPKVVQTLDELLLITRGDLKFDEQFDLHFYGADICMQAIAQGRKNYAIEAHVTHNSNLPVGYRTDSFRENEARFKAKWKEYVPILTTCTLIQ